MENIEDMLSKKSSGVGLQVSEHSRVSPAHRLNDLGRHVVT